jgi:hypothetical protein
LTTLLLLAEVAVVRTLLLLVAVLVVTALLLAHLVEAQALSQNCL